MYPVKCFLKSDTEFHDHFYILLVRQLITEYSQKGNLVCFQICVFGLKTLNMWLYEPTHFSCSIHYNVWYILTIKCQVTYSNAHDFVLALEPFLVRAHFEECWWPLIIQGHGSYLRDGDVGLEALDFHIIWFDGQVCLAMGNVEGTRGRALCLGQFVLLLACLALFRCKTVGHQLLGNEATYKLWSWFW